MIIKNLREGQKIFRIFEYKDSWHINKATVIKIKSGSILVRIHGCPVDDMSSTVYYNSYGLNANSGRLIISPENFFKKRNQQPLLLT